MFAFLASPLAKALGALTALAAIGGAYLWITTAAYNRGHSAGKTETEKRIADTIEKQRQAHVADMERLRRLPPEKLDDELKRLCRERGGTQCD